MILATGHGEFDWRFVPNHAGYSLNAFNNCNDNNHNNNNTNDNGDDDNDDDDDNAVQCITR